MDLSITANGKFVFVSDSSATVPGWLHRYEVATGSWDMQQPVQSDTFPVADAQGAKVEAVDGETVVLQSPGSSVGLSLQRFTPGQPMQLLHFEENFAFSGDIEYAWFTGEIYQMSVATNTILARYAVTGDELVWQGSARALDREAVGPLVLNSTGSVVFVENLGFLTSQVEGFDLMEPVFVLPGPVAAASDLYAFTDSSEAIFLVETQSLGSLSFSPTATVHTVASGDLWLAYPDGQHVLRCVARNVDLGCPSPWICAGQVADVLLQYGQQPTDGPDVIWGTNDADVINARGGNDLVCGRGGDDTIVGGAGNDILYGNSGNDRLVGNAGADYLVGGPDNDTLLGGAGNDRLYGVTGADVLRGEDGDDILWGFAGDDQMFGGRGNDYFAAHGGDDLLVGDAGDDRMFGGVGVDDLRGGDGADVLSGGSQNDTLTGGNGSDRLFGDAGNDTLAGGSGNDAIVGGNGNDRLFGGPDQDSCDGGLGTDTTDQNCETQLNSTEPYTLATIVETNAGNFGVLQELLQESGLDETLKGQGPFTFFAPASFAFASVADLEAIRADPVRLSELLRYHIVPGSYTTDQMRTIDLLPTLVEGEFLRVTVDASGNVILNEVASLAQPDILADNGVLHTITMVLRPE